MATAALKLFDLIQSHRITQAIYVAAKLGIAEALRDGPRPACEVAAEAGADQDSLGRLMTALVSIGLCVRELDGRYALTEVGAALDPQAAHSQKAWAILEGEAIARNWSGLLDTVITGKTPAERAGAISSYELMALSSERIAVFNAGMVDLTRLVTPEVLCAYDFSRIPHLMDVGGGTGGFVAAALKQHRHLRATVFDLKRCEDAALRYLREAGVSDRATFVAGDFFEAVPPSEGTILLKSVIHDWDDARSALILRNCRAALPRDGTLLLAERLMPETPTTSDEDRANIMSDLNMMCGPGGRERTQKWYGRLLGTSGFQLREIYPAGLFNVIEARAL